MSSRLTSDSSRLSRIFDRLARRIALGIRPGLDRVVRALARFGQPQRDYRSVHIAGTNGKGSTAAMIAAISQAAHYRTGLFTSPHLIEFNERIQVDGSNIPNEALCEIVEEVLDFDDSLTFFEVVTVTGFIHFSREKVDLAVIETGLGGRLDATKCVDPLVCVLTPIDLDHQEILGESLQSIAAEKAGIIKDGVPVVSARQYKECERVIRARAIACSAPVRVYHRDFGINLGRSDGAAAPGFDSHYRSTYRDVVLGPLECALSGAHQRENMGLSLAAIEDVSRSGLTISDKACIDGLRGVDWPGRIERIDDWLLDCAHNPSATRCLAKALEAIAPYTLIFGVSRLEAHPHWQVFDLIEPLLTGACRIIISGAQSARAIDPTFVMDSLRLDLLKNGLGGRLDDLEIAATLKEGLQRCADIPGIKVITGSAYLVGEARAVLLSSASTSDPRPLWDPR